jgi:F-type H+-transporting ATPase subunit delta
MRITKQARREARELFRNCAVNGVLEENRVRQSVQLVIERKPRGYVALLTQFQRLVKLDIARRTARIESPAPLPPQYQAQVQADLGRVYGNGLSFIFSQNPALLGGVRVQVGGDVYDGTVQARLNALEEKFLIL